MIALTMKMITAVQKLWKDQKISKNSMVVETQKTI